MTVFQSASIVVNATLMKNYNSYITVNTFEIAFMWNTNRKRIAFFISSPFVVSLRAIILFWKINLIELSQPFFLNTKCFDT